MSAYRRARSTLLTTTILLLALLTSVTPASSAVPSDLAQAPATVFGRVQLLAGVDAVNVWVTLLPIIGGQPDYNGVRYEYVEGPDNGAFSFSNVAPGSYRIEVSPPTGDAIYLDLVDQFEVTGLTTFVDRGTLVFQVAPKRIQGMVKLNGQPVENAYVYAYRSRPPYRTFYDLTDANGLFDIGVTGGEWNVYPDPPVRTAWMYTSPVNTVAFAEDATNETRAINFTVTPTVGTLEGQVVAPDGLPLPPDSCPRCIYNNDAYVAISSENGFGSRFEPLDKDGSFEIPVVAGRYSLTFYFYDQAYASFRSPPGLTAELAGGVVQLGVIRMQERSATVKGRVTSNQGAGVGQVEVYAYGADGSYESAVTNANGDYTMGLVPGSWEINLYLDAARGFIYNGEPQAITLGSGITEMVDFALTAADYQIKGTTVVGEGASEQPVTDVRGWAYARDLSNPSRPGAVTWDYIVNGEFTLNVPKGTYSVGLSLLPGSAYTIAEADELVLQGLEAAAGGVALSGAQMEALERAPYEVAVSVGEGAGLGAVEARTKLRLIPNDATLTGTLSDKNGPVKGVAGQVFATPAEGGDNIWQAADLDPLTGSYKLNLASGRWNVGYYLSGTSSEYASSPTALALIDIKPGANTYDVALTRLDGVLRGRVVDSERAKGLANQYIYVSGEGFDAWTLTDADGRYEIIVPLRTAGGQLATYTLVPELTCDSPDNCYLGANVRTVTAAPRDGLQSGMVRPQQALGDIEARKCSNCTSVSLRVELESGGQTITSGTGYTVQARVGTSGGFTSAPFNNDADRFIASITSSASIGSNVTFNINATSNSGLNINTNRSARIRPQRLAQLAQAPLDLKLELTPIAGFPDAVSATFAQSDGWSTTLKDGTSIVIPPGAVPLAPTDQRLVTVTVLPATALPYTALYDAGYPYGYTISLTKVTAEGRTVPVTAALTTPAQLTLRYSDSVLTSNSATERWVRPTVLSGDQWTVAENFVADPLENRVTVFTTSLGTWALMQPARECCKLYLPIAKR